MSDEDEDGEGDGEKASRLNFCVVLIQIRRLSLLKYRYMMPATCAKRS
jgi:hypothetical protein